MSKNIVICLDGTWNDRDDRNAMSNVALLYEMCLEDESSQVVYYDEGVGTDGWYDRKLGGLHGIGLSRNIREAYRWLAEQYEDQDRVYLFGFSRGAYTARSLSGLVYQCGLLADSEQLSSELDAMYDAYGKRDAEAMAEYKNANRACPIEMLGVWDTVGALGIPVSFLKSASDKVFGFHDTALSPEVRFACHAVAIDEKRASFEPTLWRETEDNRDRIQQVWFPGVHSDVGGGYAQRHHSDLALQWMVGHAMKRGVLTKDDNTYAYDIDLSKPVHESQYKIFGREIGVEDREASVSAKIHWSVLEKMKFTEGYKPLALMNHLQDKETLAPYEVVE